MKHILITGEPGIGKTTLVKKVVDRLNLSEADFNGFYTEEVRTKKRRTGFDIVTLDGERAVLARKRSNRQDGASTMPNVGQYDVHLEDFEKLALPALEKSKSLMIIDEIGKMEMFSEKFQESVKKLMGNKDMCVLATIPLNGGPDLVKQLKESGDCELITVTELNRDYLVETIVSLIKK